MSNWRPGVRVGGVRDDEERGSWAQRKGYNQWVVVGFEAYKSAAGGNPKKEQARGKTH